MYPITKYINIFNISWYTHDTCSAKLWNMGCIQNYSIHSLILFFRKQKISKMFFDGSRKRNFEMVKFLKNEELLNRLKVSDFEWQESAWMLSDQIVIFALLHINAKIWFTYNGMMKYLHYDCYKSAKNSCKCRRSFLF